MAWSGVANNQTISNENLQDAINTGVFSAGGTGIPLTPPDNKKQVTKGRTSSYINVPNPNYAPFYGKETNQLVVKSDIYAAGDFIVDPYPGYYQIDSLTCTGAPSFSYPVTAGNTTLPYNGVVPSQYISASMSYIGFDDPPIFDAVRLSLYVDSVLVDSQYFSVYGGSASVYLPYEVASPASIRIAVNVGFIPTPPSSFSFAGIGVNNIAISKTTGQYQVVTTGKSVVDGSIYTKSPGWICVSSDYGATWTQKSTLYDNWRKVAVSGNGQYMIAIPDNGYPIISSNYGANWSTITAVGSKGWTGVAISTSGDKMALTSYDQSNFPNKFGTNSGIYISSNYGSSWSSASLSNTEYSFIGIAMDGTGQYMCAPKQYGNIYYSTNAGVSWSSYAVNYYCTDIKSNVDGLRMIISTIRKGIVGLQDNQWRGSVNRGASFNVTLGTFDVPVVGMGLDNSNYAVACLQSNSNRNMRYHQLTSDFDGFDQNITAAGQAQYWQCYDANGGGNYHLAGTTSGLYRVNNSTIFGTWTAL